MRICLHSASERNSLCWAFSICGRFGAAPLSVWHKVDESVPQSQIWQFDNDVIINDEAVQQSIYTLLWSARNAAPGENVCFAGAAPTNWHLRAASGRKRVHAWVFLPPRRISWAGAAQQQRGRARSELRREFSSVRPSVGLVWLVNLGVGVDDKLATMRPPPARWRFLGALWLLCARLSVRGSPPPTCTPPRASERIPLRKTKNSSVALLGSIFE